LHMLIDVLHEHIHKSKMDIQVALEKIKCLQGQLVNFIMGSHDLYDFQYDDFNKPFVDAKIFMKTYSSDKNRIFQVLLDCVNEYQSPTEQLISHLILMNYSYFVLKRNPGEITYFKAFCKKRPGFFMKVLAALLDIRFFIDKASFANEQYILKYRQRCVIR